MNELRNELEVMGVERIRRGMVAFEHRGATQYSEAHDCPEMPGGTPCCFLRHAYNDVDVSKHRDEHNHARPVEAAFENWGHRTAYTSADLYAECVAFLAEHGVAVEPSVSRVAAEA